MEPGFQLLPNVFIFLIVPDDGNVIETDTRIVQVRDENSINKERSLKSASCHVALCAWYKIIHFLWVNDDMMSPTDSPNTNR